MRPFRLRVRPPLQHLSKNAPPYLLRNAGKNVKDLEATDEGGVQKVRLRDLYFGYLVYFGYFVYFWMLWSAEHHFLSFGAVSVSE